MAGGDARQAITTLDNTFQLYGKITVETLKSRSSRASALRQKGRGALQHYLGVY
jgi:hypothetical protein